MDHVVVDIEIKKRIQDVPGGWDATDKLGVACAVVYEYRSDRFNVFGDTEEHLGALRSRLDSADKITSFNGWRFDMPVIEQLGRDEFVKEFKEDDVTLTRDLSDFIDKYGFVRGPQGRVLDITC